MREDGLGWNMPPIKTVGRKTPLTPAQALAWNGSLSVLLPDWARRRPRGVFRFKTWEQANQWDQMVRKKAQSVG